MAEEEREKLFSGWVAQKALIIRDGKALISLDKNQSNWDIPGGRVHVGEEPRAGLVREIKEEIGADVEVGEVYHVGFIGASRFLIVYHVTLKNPEQEFSLAEDEIAKVMWVGKGEYADLPMWDEYRALLDRFFSEH